MVQKHEKVHFLEAIYLHHVSQVVLKRINGADTWKSTLSGSHIPAPCVICSFEEDQWFKHLKVHFLETMSLHHVSQVVLKRINGTITQKSALSGSHNLAPCVKSSFEEDQWCKHTQKCTFWSHVSAHSVCLWPISVLVVPYQMNGQTTLYWTWDFHWAWSWNCTWSIWGCQMTSF